MNHIKKISIIAYLFAATTSYAQDLEWAKSFGGISDYSFINLASSLDAQGNIYTAGSFEGTVDFDPGVGTFNLTSAGEKDIFVQKIDATGNFLWAKSFGGNNREETYSMSIDALGSIYLTGEFRDTVDFDPGAGMSIHISAGNKDAFVLKLDASGNFIWANSFIGSSAVLGKSICIDPSGNVYTAGVFYQTADFDPGPGIFNLSSAALNNVFIQKMDALGNFLWAKTFEGSSSFTIKADNAGNIYTTGEFWGIADFDPGPGIFNLSSNGQQDIYIQKMDALGNFLWAKSFGGEYSEWSHSMCIDNLGNVYTTGSFWETADFNPESGASYFLTAEFEDAFVQKMDSSGNFIWAISFEGQTHGRGLSIALDASGNVYTTGEFSANVDFDPGPGVFNISSSNQPDIFIHKMDSSGNLIWVETFGDDLRDKGQSINIDELGNVYTSGYFSGIVNFDPGSEPLNLTSMGNEGVFIQKISQNTIDQSVSYNPNGIILEWTPFPNSLACQIKGGFVGGTDPHSFIVQGTEPSQKFINGNDLIIGQDYQWKVRCATEINPYGGITPFVGYHYFVYDPPPIANFDHTQEQSSQELKLKTYPNPALGEVIVTLENWNNKGFQIELMDQNGKIIKSFIKNVSQFKLELRDLSSGVYFLNLITLNGQLLCSEKLVIE